jgi:hypothetical protein
LVGESGKRKLQVKVAPFARSNRWAEPRQLCPGTSDVDLLRNVEGIVDLDAKVADGTFHLWPAGHSIDCPVPDYVRREVIDETEGVHHPFSAARQATARGSRSAGGDAGDRVLAQWGI